MNAPYDIIRRTNQLLVAGADLLSSPLLLALRLYFFWQLFLTGQGKLSNIGKVSEFFASLHIPLPIGLSEFATMFTVDWGSTMAAAFLMTVPVVAVFLAFQRQFVSGLSAGAVKG